MTHILSALSLITLGIVVFYSILFFLARNKINRIIFFVGKHSLLLSFVIATAGVFGSLIYSEVFGYLPCKLCWIQRIFLYPQAIIFFLAIWKKDYRVWFYTLPLSVMGGLVAVYHAYTQVAGGSFLPCTSEGGACSKVFFVEYGFITIPAMAAVTFLMLIVLAFHAKYYSSHQ